MDSAGFFLLLAAPLAVIAGVLMAAAAAPRALPGAAREAARKMSLQIPLALAVLTPILAAGTMDVSAVSLVQAGGLCRWLVFHDPFNAMAFILSCAAVQGIAKNRLEASRIFAAGLLGPALLFALSALQTVLFLGSCFDPFGLVRRLDAMAPGSAGHGLAIALAVLVFTAKCLLLCYLYLLFRRNLPRYRFDEVMKLCLKILIPAACINLGAAAAYLWLAEPLGAFQAGVQIFLAIAGVAGALALAAFLAWVLAGQRRYAVRWGAGGVPTAGAGE